MNYATCKGCGRKIIWATNPVTRKKVPIEHVPVYRVYEKSGGVVECLQEDAGDDEIMGINHFLTCPQAANFSGRNKQ